jgi:hypothetical protein
LPVATPGAVIIALTSEASAGPVIRTRDPSDA